MASRTMNDALSSPNTAGIPIAIRTPEERFAILPGFPYDPIYADKLPGFEPNLRLCYYDTDPSIPPTRPTFLCLHGQPSWSYLYRKMIPIFQDDGKNRVVCIDLFGFGRSDKLLDRKAYSFHFHRNSLLRLLERLQLQNITLVCQDWGGILGLTLPMEFPSSVFTNVLAMNTGIATGKPLSKGFMAWRRFAAAATDIPVAGLIAMDVAGGGKQSQLSMLDVMAYDAPFPDVRYKAGVHAFPLLVPIEPTMEGADVGQKAAQWWRKAFQGKAFVAVGVRDRVTGLAQMEEVRKYLFPQAPPLMRVEEGGHFVQEFGEEIALRAMQHFSNPQKIQQSKL